MTTSRKRILASIVIFSLLLPGIPSFAGGKGLMDPMTKGSWFINFGFGPGTNWQGAYGGGFLPAVQAAFETGMWEVGPGVITLGGEVGGTFFSFTGTDSRYGPATTYKYNYTELVFAVRGAYHYGWNVQGLDTYGGVAAGPRFTLLPIRSRLRIPARSSENRPPWAMAAAPLWEHPISSTNC